MTDAPSIKTQAWLNAPETRALLDALSANGGAARFVGGCVRNALLGIPVKDIDVATPLTPDEVAARAKAAGFNIHEIGIEHGTLLVTKDKKEFEVTTLRRDVTTDGRRATVAFSKDWTEDAQRRDFTMNALYADASGQVFDYTNGIADLKAQRVRFIGDAGKRIAEDYLRILRLFRFHALYGKGEIDADGLRACSAAKDQIKTLSGERIQSEMLKLMAADGPVPVFRTMAASGVLAEVLPGPLNFDRFQRLCDNDGDQFLAPDSLLRLGAILTDVEQARGIAERWRLSNNDRNRLITMLSASVKVVSYMSIREVRRALYRHGADSFKDWARLRWAEDPKPSNAIQWRALGALADSWQRPEFPVTGTQVMAAGVPQGPLVGQVLGEVEDWWIDSDFTDDPFSLAERLKAVVQATI